MDLTKITTPLGLLDEATQKALRECGGPWEVLTFKGWSFWGGAGEWACHRAYRLKPQPPKPWSGWVEFDDAGFAFRVHEDSDPVATPMGHRLIRVVEVIE